MSSSIQFTRSRSSLATGLLLLIPALVLTFWGLLALRGAVTGDHVDTSRSLLLLSSLVLYSLAALSWSACLRRLSTLGRRSLLLTTFAALLVGSAISAALYQT